MVFFELESAGIAQDPDMIHVEFFFTAKWYKKSVLLTSCLVFWIVALLKTGSKAEVFLVWLRIVLGMQNYP